MTEPPDLDALARRYADLWQDQVAAAAVDAELQDAMARLMRLMGENLAAAPALWQGLWVGATAWHGASSGFGTRNTHGDDGSAGATILRDGPASGAAPAAGPSADRGLDLVQFDARLAVLEKRLATLEARPRATRRKPRARSRRDGAA
jgi:hypothetical protein